MPPSLILLELRLEKILISHALEYDRPKGFSGEPSHLQPSPLSSRSLLTHLSLYLTGISSLYYNLSLLPPMLSLPPLSRICSYHLCNVPVEVGQQCEWPPGLLPLPGCASLAPLVLLWVPTCHDGPPPASLVCLFKPVPAESGQATYLHIWIIYTVIVQVGKVGPLLLKFMLLRSDALVRLALHDFSVDHTPDFSQEGRLTCFKNHKLYKTSSGKLPPCVEGHFLSSGGLLNILFSSSFLPAFYFHSWVY